MLVHFTFFTLFRYPFLSWTKTSSFSNTFGYIEKVFRVNIGFKRQVLFIVLFIIYHNDISPLNALSQYAVSDPCCIHIHYTTQSFMFTLNMLIQTACCSCNVFTFISWISHSFMFVYSQYVVLYCLL